MDHTDLDVSGSVLYIVYLDVNNYLDTVSSVKQVGMVLPVSLSVVLDVQSLTQVVTEMERVSVDVDKDCMEVNVTSPVRDVQMVHVKSQQDTVLRDVGTDSMERHVNMTVRKTAQCRVVEH